MSKENSSVILVHETALNSWMRDASTFALFSGLIGIGVVLDSSALQWCGAIIAFITIGMRGSGKAPRMSIAEARAKLDELERAA